MKTETRKMKKKIYSNIQDELHLISHVVRERFRKYICHTRGIFVNHDVPINYSMNYHKMNNRIVRERFGKGFESFSNDFDKRICIFVKKTTHEIEQFKKRYFK